MKIANETKIGILTAFAITCLILGYNFLRGNDVFSNSRDFYTIYDRVEGLTASKPVLVNGFQIGRVKKMELTPDHKVKAIFDITSNLQIPKNTIARITSTDLLGGKAVVFVLGDSKEMAHEGDQFVPDVEQSITETLSPIKDKAAVVMIKVDSMLSSINNILNPEFQRNINKSMNSIAHSLKNVEAVSGNLNSQMDRLGIIMKNIEAITANFKNNNQRINNIMANLDKVTDQVAKANLQETLLNASKSLANVNSILAKIQNGEGTLGLLLNDKGLYDNLNKSAADLDKLMIDLKENPKRYVRFSVFGGGKDKKPSE
ncbi:MlaD family protein [Solitalea koreensis]|uniref:Phospholipid/cholesterol/gamma-HCH transport system substrate-binding protein n=1 Tax=Solitalea koreensis TaxID=543615 RepID=A0A521BBA1_9SPHI|nr:MlaD family protein [Solitalea koreensis]SMO44366.1 phospholipid/cholesterol/gamma-HCH transport system substrate-binding protein [Solitalea koreensis]